MRRLPLAIATLLSLLSLAAFGAAGAMAATSLTLRTAAGALAVGAPVTASSSDVVFATPEGAVHCSRNVLTGTLEVNGAARDRSQITGWESGGAGGGGCTSPLGEAYVKGAGLPWSYEYGANGTTALVGNVQVTATFPQEGRLECTYSAKKISGTVSLPGPIDISTRAQVFTLSGSNTFGCPPEGTLSGSWTVSSAGSPLQGELRGGDGALAGTVSGAGNIPVAGVQVAACAAGQALAECATATTEAAGGYSLPGLLEGTYSVTATPPANSGYATTTTPSVTVTTSETTTQDVALLERGSIEGTVSDQAAAPVADVQISICSQEAKPMCMQASSGASGAYAVSGVPDGQYVAVAEPPVTSGYARTRTSVFSVQHREASVQPIVLLPAGSVGGTVESGGNPVQGALVSACSAAGECFSGESDSSGTYLVAGVAPGSYVATVSPPAGYGGAGSGPIEVAASTTTTENFTLQPPTAPPVGTSVSGQGQTVIAGVAVPVVNWSTPSPITTTGCAGGTVQASITARNLATGAEESSPPAALTETSPGSGVFSGSLPAAYPLHGEGVTTISVSGCPEPAQDHTDAFTIYIDPSGEVLDAADGNAPVSGATVTLLTSESPAGPFIAVPDGSTTMSPANRRNPDTSNSLGAFGWDTIPGYYEVTASKQGCGSVTTPEFEVPPPVSNLELVLHCALRVDTTSLPAATRGAPYQAQLSASGEAPPFKWKKTAALPKGLKLSSTGLLSGTPSSKRLAPGSYQIAVQITDAKKRTATGTVALQIS